LREKSLIQGRGWKSTFLTNEKSTAEERCREQEIEFEWLPDGCLRTTSKLLPGVKLEERTGKN